MSTSHPRRDVLALLGGSLVPLAGCLGSSDGSTTDPTATTTATDVPSETPGTAATPQWESVGLVGTGVTCGGTPRVAFREVGERVRVVGTLVVSSLCYRAGLRTAAVADGVARLVVVQRDRERDGTPACGQCIADAGFEVTGRFVGSLPDELVVELRGQRPETYRTPV
jgi:hypothetical protein